jgi:hypothetical protein
LLQILTQSDGNRAFTAASATDIANADHFKGRAVAFVAQDFSPKKHQPGIQE